MAECDNGTLMQVATNEDGMADVYLPVERWQDVKAVRTVGRFEGAVRVILSGAQVRVLDGPTGIMIDVCVEMMSADEIKARDDAEAEAARASVEEAHAPAVAAAEAEVQAKVEMHDAVKAQVADKDAEAERVTAAESDVKAAEKALADAQAARDKALAEASRG